MNCTHKISRGWEVACNGLSLCSFEEPVTTTSAKESLSISEKLGLLAFTTLSVIVIIAMNTAFGRAWSCGTPCPIFY